MKMKIGEINFRLTAIKQTKFGNHTKAGRWLFHCQCGNDIEATVCNVRSGHVKSCGCLNSEMTAARNYKHGLAGSFEHRAWLRMRQRVQSDEEHKRRVYKNRGIKVCDAWQNDFPRFFADVGLSPSKLHQIDRIDNERGYEPGNVRWVTKSEQMKNRRLFSRNRNR